MARATRGLGGCQTGATHIIKSNDRGGDRTHDLRIKRTLAGRAPWGNSASCNELAVDPKAPEGGETRPKRGAVDAEVDATALNAVPAAVRLQQGAAYRVVWDDAGWLRMADRAVYDAPAGVLRLNKGRGVGRIVPVAQVVLAAPRKALVRCGGEVFRPVAPFAPEAA